MLISRHSKGNVLFLILIAVALFGMLTVAITRSEQGSTSMDRERGTINASDLMSYSGAMEKTVARMLGDDMSEGGLSFANDVWERNDGTKVELAANFANCTSDKCKVFYPNGGGLDAKTFNAQPLDVTTATDIKPGHAGVYAIRIAGIGSDAHDLVLLIAGVDQNTCKQINDKLGILNPSGFPPADAWGGANLYNGSFTGPTNPTDAIGDAATQVAGKAAGCVARSGSSGGKNDNVLYQVLLPR